jgi:hypothetical protein
VEFVWLLNRIRTRSLLVNQGIFANTVEFALSKTRLAGSPATKIVGATG